MRHLREAFDILGFSPEQEKALSIFLLCLVVVFMWYWDEQDEPEGPNA